MGTSARSLIRNLPINEIIDDLNRLNAYYTAAFMWTRTVANRLEGTALLHLDEELEEEATKSLAAADRLAVRIAELGGETTGHPRQLTEKAGITEFHIPHDTADPNAILGYALEQLRQIIPVIDDLAQRIRFDDPITYQLVIELLAAAVTRDDEIEAVLKAGEVGPAS